MHPVNQRCVPPSRLVTGPADVASLQGVEPEMYAALRKTLNAGVQYQARARVAVVKPKPDDDAPAPAKQRRLPGMVCVVSAGPEDQAAADQVKLLAEHLGCFVTTKAQLSIRNLPGLLDHLPGRGGCGGACWRRGQGAGRGCEASYATLRCPLCGTCLLAVLLP